MRSLPRLFGAIVPVTSCSAALARLAVCAVLALQLVASARAGDDGAWTAMTLDEGSIRFQAHVSGDPVAVRLGSASPSNSIRESFVRAHSKRALDADTPLDDLPPLIDLPLLIESRRIVLPTVYRVEGTTFDVHAGRDFFSDAIVQIDFPNRRLRVLDEDALALRELSNVRARRVNERIGTHIEIGVEDQKLWAAIATEYSGTLMIPRALARQYGWLEADRVQIGEIVDNQGNRFLSEGVDLDHVTIGPYRVADVRAVIMEDDESPLAGSYEQLTAIVGNELLQHFQLSIDLNRAYVHVQTP